MTIEPETGVNTSTWTVAEAKAKFSEVIEHAQTHGPQTITRHGRSAVVIVSIAEWERTTGRAGNLAEFFAASPLRDSGLVIQRRKGKPRPIDL
jgi:prevent-host-death family protein